MGLSHFSHIPLFSTLWTVARQAPLSMRFSRKEYWTTLHFSFVKTINWQPSWCIHLFGVGWGESVSSSARPAPVAQMVKNLPASAGDPGSIPGSGRSPGEGNGSPLQYSCLENSTDRGTWQTTVHGVTTKSQTQLSNKTHTQPTRGFQDSGPCALFRKCHPV